MLAMSYNEKQFTSAFSSWIKNMYITGQLKSSAAFELKVKKHKQRLNLKSDMRPQQLPALERAKKSFVYHKISDQSTNCKPFDSFVLSRADSFLVVLWYKKQAPKTFVMIPIINLLLFAQANNKKSISEDEAKEIGYVYTI